MLVSNYLDRSVSIKGLFFVNESVNDNSGIGKKILSQYKSFNSLGFSMKLCYLQSRHGLIERFFGNKAISSYSDTKVGKLFLEMSYLILYREIIKNEIKFIYIRYIHFSTPMFLLFLYTLKKANIVIYFEIPTYPYDSESEPVGGISIIKRFVEKKLRYPMGKIVDRIVTFSDHRYIWGAKTINISNAIDLSFTPLVKKINHADNSLHFIGVATISFWHGYDRMIHSLAKYYKHNNKDNRKVVFHIVGEGPEKANLESLTDKYKLHDYVKFHGIKIGTSLDEIFNHCDLAIDSLGRHRSGNNYNNSLKSKEYIARGLPFIKSHIDDSLYSNFYYDVAPNESVFDLQLIIDWFDKLVFSPDEIRNDAEKYYSWDIQIKKILVTLQGDLITNK